MSGIFIKLSEGMELELKNIPLTDFRGWTLVYGLKSLQICVVFTLTVALDKVIMYVKGDTDSCNAPKQIKMWVR